MDMLKQWIITIVSVIILLAFIEILIPNNNKKKYINFIIGLIVMISIIKPLINFIGLNQNLNDQIIEVSDYLEYGTMKKRLAHNNYFEIEAVVELYKQNLKEQIKNHIEKTTDYSVSKINIAIEEEDETNLGIINEVEIVLKHVSEESQIVTDNKIQDIEINISLNEKNNTVETQSINVSNEEYLIKDDLSNHYGLEKEKVHLYIQNDK